MRGGIPVDKHGNVITYYGDYSTFQEVLGMQDTNFAYVYLLDQRGFIRWKGKGFSNPKTLKELIEIAKSIKKEFS